MNFFELAINRYSSRKYKDTPVEEEKLIKVLEAARIAPSAVNKQPWHIIVVRDAENRKNLCKTYKRDWLKQAPVILVMCGDHSVAWKRSVDNKYHTDIDVSIATDHITLAATELGLATCWVCNFDVKKCAGLFGLPEHIEPIALIPLGYPADEPDLTRHTSKRKSLREIVHWETF